MEWMIESRNSKGHSPNPGSETPENCQVLGAVPPELQVIRFGNPRSGCRNYGICRIAPLEDLPLFPLPEGQALAHFHLGQFLWWYMLADSLQPVTRQRYFGEPYFEMREPYDWTCQQIRLLPGRWPILPHALGFMLPMPYARIT